MAKKNPAAYVSQTQLFWLNTSTRHVFPHDAKYAGKTRQGMWLTGKQVDEWRSERGKPAKWPRGIKRSR